MARIRPTRRTVAFGALVLLLAAAMVACATAAPAGGSPAPAAPATSGGEFRSATGGDALAPASGPGGTAKLQLATDQRQIVKTGEITLQVTSVANASGRIRAMALELGGYVGGSQAGTLDQSATLTLRIPAARFDDALSRLHEIGDKVLVEATREEDVTSAVVDLEARLKNLETSEVQYRALMAKATKIEDILSVQSRLDDVQGQIEELSAQLKQLSNQADLATLTVTLQPQPEPIKEASATWDPGETASTAVGALLSVAQALGTAGIWLAIVGLPILVVVAILALVAARLGLLRRRTPAAGPVPNA